MEPQYDSPIYVGPSRPALLVAAALLLVFLIWAVAVWPGGAETEPSGDVPAGQLEVGTLPPPVEGAGALPETG
jgi:hypothetical protein